MSIAARLKQIVPIQTEDFCIQLTTEEDAEWIAQSWSDKEYVCKYTQSGIELNNREIITQYKYSLQYYKSENKEGLLAFLKIIDESTKRPIGAIHFRDTKLNSEPGLLVGYWVEKNEQHKGVITRTIKAIKKVLKEKHISCLLIAEVTKDNIKSINVLKRTGFKFCGYRAESDMNVLVFTVRI